MAEVMRRTKINELPSQAEEIDETGLIVYTEDGSKVYCARMTDFVAKVKELYSQGGEEGWSSSELEEGTDTEDWHISFNEDTGLSYITINSPNPYKSLGGSDQEQAYYPNMRMMKWADTDPDGEDPIKIDANLVFHGGVGVDGGSEDKPFEHVKGTYDQKCSGSLATARLNKLYISTVSQSVMFDTNEVTELKLIMRDILRGWSLDLAARDNNPMPLVPIKCEMHDIFDIPETSILYDLPIIFCGYFMLQIDADVGNTLHGEFVYPPRKMYYIENDTHTMSGWYYDDAMNFHPTELDPSSQHYGERLNWLFISSHCYLMYPAFYNRIPGFSNYVVGTAPDTSDITKPWISVYKFDVFSHSGSKLFPLYEDLHSGDGVTYGDKILAAKNMSELANKIDDILDDMAELGFNVGLFEERFMVYDPYEQEYDDGSRYFPCCEEGMWVNFMNENEIIIVRDGVNYVCHTLKPDYESLHLVYTTGGFITGAINFDQWYHYGGTDNTLPVHTNTDYGFFESYISNYSLGIGAFGKVSPEQYLNLALTVLNRDYMIVNSYGRTTKPYGQWTGNDDSIFVGEEAYCHYILNQILNHGMSVDGKPYISKFTINGYDFTEQTQLTYQKQVTLLTRAVNGLATYYDRTTHRYSIGLTQELYSQLQPALEFGDGIEYDEETGEVTAEGSCRDILVNGRTVVNPLNKTASINLANVNLIQECQIQPGTNYDGHTVVAREMVEEFDTDQIRHTYYSYTIGLSSDIIPSEQAYNPSQVNIGPYEYGPYTVGATQSLPSNESYVVIFDTVIVSPVDSVFCLFLKDNNHQSGYPFDPSNQYYDSDYVDFDIQCVKANVPTKFRIVKVVPATNDSPVTFASYQAAIMNTLPYSAWPLPSNIYAYGNTTVKKLINV